MRKIVLRFTYSLPDSKQQPASEPMGASGRKAYITYHVIGYSTGTDQPEDSRRAAIDNRAVIYSGLMYLRTVPSSLLHYRTPYSVHMVTVGAEDDCWYERTGYSNTILQRVIPFRKAAMTCYVLTKEEMSQLQY